METGFRPVGLGANPIPWRGFLHCLTVMATFVGNLDNKREAHCHNWGRDVWYPTLGGNLVQDGSPERTSARFNCRPLCCPTVPTCTYFTCIIVETEAAVNFG